MRIATQSLHHIAQGWRSCVGMLAGGLVPTVPTRNLLPLPMQEPAALASSPHSRAFDLGATTLEPVSPFTVSPSSGCMAGYQHTQLTLQFAPRAGLTSHQRLHITYRVPGQKRLQVPPSTVDLKGKGRLLLGRTWGVGRGATMGALSAPCCTHVRVSVHVLDHAIRLYKVRVWAPPQRLHPQACAPSLHSRLCRPRRAGVPGALRHQFPVRHGRPHVP